MVDVELMKLKKNLNIKLNRIIKKDKLAENKIKKLKLENKKLKKRLR